MMLFERFPDEGDIGRIVLYDNDPRTIMRLFLLAIFTRRG
jgi:hypothetical protein